VLFNVTKVMLKFSTSDHSWVRRYAEERRMQQRTERAALFGGAGWGGTSGLAATGISTSPLTPATLGSDDRAVAEAGASRSWRTMIPGLDDTTDPYEVCAHACVCICIFPLGGVNKVPPAFHDHAVTHLLGQP
jgi:hypothetical protein